MKEPMDIFLKLDAKVESAEVRERERDGEEDARIIFVRKLKSTADDPGADGIFLAFKEVEMASSWRWI